MKRWLLHILLVGVFGMLAASCSQEADDPTLATEGGRVQLKFTIVLDDSPSSRTWGGTYTSEEATLAENAVNNLQILLFKGDGSTYYGTLENVQYFSVDPLDKIYEFQGSILLDADDNLVTTTNGVDKLNCKIMVLANCSVDLTGLTAIGDILGRLNEKVFSVSSIYDATNGLKAGIPMWGIYTVSDLDVDRNYATDLDDDIYLLRSMAKIEVTLSDETWNNGYRITSATLNKYNAEGYVVPVFMIPEEDDKTEATTQIVALSSLDKTTDLLLEGVFNEKQDLANPSTLGFTATTTNRTYVVYVPEMVNDASSSIKMDLGLGKVTGTDANGNETIDNVTGSVTSFIELKDYNLTDDYEGYYDIIRNWYYKYTINSISDGSPMVLTCTVQPWNLIEESLDYRSFISVSDAIEPTIGIQYNTDIVMVDQTVGTIYTVMSEDGNVSSTTQSTATFKIAQLTFTLATPVGYDWHASLIADEVNKPFAFVRNVTYTETGGMIFEVDENSNVLTTNSVTGQVGEQATLTIISTYTDDELVEAVTNKLQIVVRNELINHTMKVEDGVLGGTYQIVHNK